MRHPQRLPVPRITSGPFRSIKACLEFIQYSDGVEEDRLIECFRAYPMPPSYTNKQLLDLIRFTRADLP